jgi:hypothetical protein
VYIYIYIYIVDGKIILRWIFRKWGGGFGDWMELAQDRDRWRTLVSTVRNLWVPKMRGISLLAENWKC